MVVGTMGSRLRLPDEVVARLQEAGVDLGVRSMPDRRRSQVGRFAEVEIREGQAIELRDIESKDGAEIGRFAGFSTSYDQPYDIYGGPDRGGFTEIMGVGAWTRTISERVDVNLLENHEGRPFARVGNGTLELSEPSDLGVMNLAALDLRRSDARDLYLTLERGDYCKMSCAFMVLRDKWNPGYTQRTILEVVGFDSSVVTFPANPNTLATVGDGTPTSPKARAVSGVGLELARAEWYRLAG